MEVLRQLVAVFRELHTAHKIVSYPTNCEEKNLRIYGTENLCDVPQFISLYRQEVNIDFLLRFFHLSFLLLLLQIPQIFHQRMHTMVKQVVGTHQNLNLPGNGKAPYLPHK